MLDFVPVSPDNWRVPLSVSPDQAEFVADKVTTLARAFAYRIFDSQAMTQLLEKFRSERKFSAVQLCILSQNTPAKALYQSLGFVETGEYDEDEIVLRLEF
ncbi:TPA: hypothetical protein U1362_001994 [Streptococcus suis]|nr:hypothetical protein [Streptococcus suis]